MKIQEPLNPYENKLKYFIFSVHGTLLNKRRNFTALDQITSDCCYIYSAVFTHDGFFFHEQTRQYHAITYSISAS